MARYEHQGGAKATTLASEITASATSFTVADATNWPTGSSFPFWVVIDRGKAAEEKILCSSRTGTLISVSSRGQDGTSAASHDGGATVEHCLTATEIDKFDAVVEDPAANWSQGNAAYEPLGGTTRGARAYASTAQSLTSGTATALNFDSETFDTAGFHDTVTNPSRFTIPAGAAGTYVVVGGVGFAANATGTRAARIHVNGVVGAITSVEADRTAGLPTRLTVSDVLVLAAGDYVELAGYQLSGGALNTETVRTFLVLFKIGA